MDPTPTAPLPPWPTWPARRLLVFIALVFAGNNLAQILTYSLVEDLFLPVLVGSLLGVVLPCRMLARGHGGTLRRDFHLDRLDVGTLAAAIIAAAAALLPSSALATLSARIHPVDPQWLATLLEHLPTSGLGIAVAAAVAVLAGPLAEELLFRGLIYRLARRTWGPGPRPWCRPCSSGWSTANPGSSSGWSVSAWSSPTSTRRQAACSRR